MTEVGGVGAVGATGAPGAPGGAAITLTDVGPETAGGVSVGASMVMLLAPEDIVVPVASLETDVAPLEPVVVADAASLLEADSVSLVGTLFVCACSSGVAPMSIADIAAPPITACHDIECRRIERFSKGKEGC